MGAIADAFNEAFRAYVVDGVPGSGANPPAKIEARALGALIEAILGPNNPPLTITADHTLTLDDWNRWIIVDGSSDVVITVPAEADLAFPTNFNTWVHNRGTARVSVAGDGFTVEVDELSNAVDGCQRSVSQIARLDADDWIYFGRLEAA